jgi:hypothetical protein
MPSSEGDEIEIAMSKGIRQENIVIVDENPAIVASLKGRKFPLVTAKGCRISEIGPKLVKAGIHLDIANLDFTGTVHTVFDELIAFAHSNALNDAALIGVTVLKGREPKSTFNLVQHISKGITQHDFDDLLQKVFGEEDLTTDKDAEEFVIKTMNAPGWSGRLALLGAALAHKSIGNWTEVFPSNIVTIRHANEYKSKSGIVMLYAVFSTHKQPCFCSSCLTNVLARLRLKDPSVNGVDVLETIYGHYNIDHYDVPGYMRGRTGFGFGNWAGVEARAT